MESGCNCSESRPTVELVPAVHGLPMAASEPWPEPIPWKGSFGPVTHLDTVVRASVVETPYLRTSLPTPPPAAEFDAAAAPARPQLVTLRRKSEQKTPPIDSAAVAPAPSARQVAAPASSAATTKRASFSFGKFWKRTPPKRPGSGIPARRGIRILLWTRRFSQVFFIGLFLWFLAETAFRGTFAAKSTEPVRLPWPVESFLLADPYVAAMTLLSTHTLYRGLALSGVVLGLTLVFGRVFCGWICPFGTLHHFFGWIFPSRYLRGGKRVNSNKTHGWQITKYYLLLAFLGAALFGSAIGGLMDPICVAVRAIGLGVFPMLQYVAIRLTDLVTLTHVRPLQAASDSMQEQLASHVWTANQSYFHQTWLIVFLLVAILFMNRIIPRFWCRALCPLGAFLGVFSRFALFGMKKDHAKCTDCNLCLVHCQAADSPQGGVKHRQEECHVCLNCESACPEDVIKWGFLPNRQSSVQTPNWQRRTVMASAAAGAIALPAMRIANWPDKAYSEKVIRPPGAVEERDS